ncbi:multicopper oxidase domain-containing protein [Actinokineospora enzanensis]|uniref:multicopper oxidase domain-containing protein n=1 Tax=Actinokineospora enzanensis TaxID=155975 RepID=UPI000A075497
MPIAAVRFPLSARPLRRGRKDTVDVLPAEFVDVAVRFTAYPGRYLVHCHNLEHEDMMMATFRTTP